MKDFRRGLTQADLFVFGKTSPCVLELFDGVVGETT